MAIDSVDKLQRKRKHKWRAHRDYTLVPFEFFSKSRYKGHFSKNKLNKNLEQFIESRK